MVPWRPWAIDPVLHVPAELHMNFETRLSECNKPSTQCPMFSQTPTLCKPLSHPLHSGLVLIFITAICPLFPPRQPAQYAILLLQAPNLRNQRLVPRTLHPQRLPRVLCHPAQSRLPLCVLETQLHARPALLLQQRGVVLVQREDRRGLCVCVGAQFVEEQREGVFVVGYQGGEGGVGGVERGDCGFR